MDIPKELQERLERTRKKQAAWVSESVDKFRDCFRSDEKLRDAFVARESLTKNGARFPTVETPPHEIRVALDAINKGDNRVFGQLRGDSRRARAILGEVDRDGMPCFPNVYAIREYIGLTNILSYEAAIYYAIPNELQRAYAELNSAFPDDGSEEIVNCIKSAQDAMELAVKQAIALEILKHQYQLIFQQIVHPAIPTEFKLGIAALPDTASALELKEAIIKLHKMFSEIKQAIKEQIGMYENLKSQLTTFLEDNLLPAELLEEGRALLRNLITAEGSNEGRYQRLALSSKAAIQNINSFQIKAQTRIAALRTFCEQAQSELEDTLNNPHFNESLKNQGKRLLSEYKQFAATPKPWTQLQAKAQALKDEHHAILYKQAVETLEMVIVYAPLNHRREAESALGQVRTNPERLSKPLVLAYLASSATAAENKATCDAATNALQQKLDNEDIDASFKIDGIALQAEFLAAITEPKPVDILLALAKKLNEESQAIQYRHEAKTRYAKLLEKLEALRQYGETLGRTHRKSIHIEAAYRSLKTKVSTLLLGMTHDVNANHEHIRAFEHEFLQTLHSYQNDQFIKQHRKIWNPIIINFAIACTGIGLLAIIAKLGVEAFRSRNSREGLTFNQALFFANTNSQQQLSNIEELAVSTNQEALKPQAG